MPDSNVSPRSRRLATALVLCLLLTFVPVSAVMALEPEPPDVVSVDMEGLPGSEVAEPRSDAGDGQSSSDDEVDGEGQGDTNDGAADDEGTAPSVDESGEPDAEGGATEGVGPREDDPSGEPQTADARLTPIIEADIPFNLIGFKVPDGLESVMVRTSEDAEHWTGWFELGVEDPELDGPDPGSEEARNATTGITEPLWVGEARYFQVRVDGVDLGEITASLVDATGLSEPVTSRLARYLTPRSAPAEASVGPPNIVSRSQWGANESWVKRSPSYAPTVDHVIVHHTANSNNYSRSDGPALVRSIYHWHTHANGWNDIGYNILIDRYGVVYEGRRGGLDKAVVGAHAAGFNTGSFGVAVIGNFDIADVPSAAYASLSQTVAWKMRLHGMNMNPHRTFTKNGRTVNTISGHRAVGSTACPGRFLYQRLPHLRVQAATAGMPSTGGTPIVGDWNGDGRDTPGIFANGTFYLRNSNSAGYPEVVIPFGRAGDRPIVGDWNGDGRTGIGVVRRGTWYLRDRASPGPATRVFVFGRVLSGDIPIVGDWNRSGTHGVGIVRSGGEWHQRNSLSAGYADNMYVFGRVAGGDFPVTGDWNGDGRTTVGVVRGPEWMLRDRNSAGFADRVIRFGRSGDVPIVGDWNGDGKQTIGVVRNRTWHLNDGITPGYAETTFRY